MAVKIYRARSIQEAVRRIKEELGMDAVILSTRRVPKNVRDPYGRDMFEIRAAASGEVPVSDRPAALETEPRPLMEPSIFDHDPSDSEPAPGDVNSEARWNAVAAELVSIKDMLFLMNRCGDIPELLSRRPQCLDMYARLVKSGISDRNAHALITQSGVLSDRETHRADHIRRRVLKQVAITVSAVDPFATRNGRAGLSAFIGPTGVGKTTTIAKVAAKLKLKRNQRVGIISVDNYRIGAFDQINTYAAIMGLPCLPAFTRKDLEIAVGKMGNCDVILIDTAGQSHLDRGRIRELDEILGEMPGMQCHLVLSATTNSRDMKEAAENFSRLNPYSYVFTKLDETRRRGCIIDQVMNMNMPVSFLTNGQRVPEDIIDADAPAVIRNVFSRRDS